MLRIKNFDYQSIKSFDKVYKKENCKSKKCFKYYMRRTHRDKNYSIQQTFSYIDKHYSKLKYNKTLNAGKIRENTNKLINRLCDLNYENNISFSVITSIVISLVISLFIAFLQIPISELGENYFEFCNDALKEAHMYINESIGLLDIIINVLYYLLVFILLMSIILIFAFGLPALIRNIYDYSVYNRTFIIPYEREIVKKTLLTYSDDYKFL